MMNILVTNISTLPKPDPRTNTILERVYSIQTHAACEVESIKAVHTNESVVKCLAEMKDVKESGGIHKIVALVLYASLNEVNGFFGTTAYEYFKQHAIDLFQPDPQFITVQLEIEKNKLRPMSDIMSELCANIGEKDRVYIDVAGGRRTENNIIQLLTKILKYKGIETPYSLYSDINVGNRILDTADFDKMMALSDAFNEFMTTGKSDQLKGCFLNPLPEILELLEKMGDFSDSIRLGSVDCLDDTIRSLKLAIQFCNKIPESNIETVILKQSLPVIEKKLLSDGNGLIDYCKIVQWCLDNALVQQALTVFVEKIPTFIFDQKIICFKGLINKEKADYKKIRESNPSKPAAWESDALYTKLLDLSNIIDFEEFKDCILKGRPSNNKDVKSAVEILRKIKKCFPKPIYLKNATPLEMEIVRFINKSTIVDYSGLINSLTANLHPLTKKLLGFNDEMTDDVMKKMITIDSIRQGKMYHGPFTWNIKNEILSEMLYGCMYVKLMRNQINHASSEENFSNDSKAVLIGLGYDFSSFNMSVVKSNIQKALDSVRKAQQCVNEKNTLNKANETSTLSEQIIAEPVTIEPPKVIKTEIPHLQSPMVLGKIDLDKISKKQST